jgi:hypothetical protein
MSNANYAELAETVAQDVLDLRAEHTRVKERLAEAETALKGLLPVSDEVVLKDGTVVRHVVQTRTSWDGSLLKELLSKGRFTRVTKRVPDPKAIEVEIEQGRIVPDEIEAAARRANVSQIRVTIPKRDQIKV